MSSRATKIKIVTRAQGFPDLVVDRKHSTLINTNSGALKAYIAERARLRRSNAVASALKRDVEALNKQMQDMRCQLQEIVNGHSK